MRFTAIMLRRRIFHVFITILILASGPLHAGAWLREPKTAFVSASTRLTAPPDDLGQAYSYNTFYGEYGVTEQLTLGLDLGQGSFGDSKQIGFIRLPLYQPDTGWRIATELGFGASGVDLVIRPGLSIGRGTENGHGYGWQAADLNITYYPSTGHWDTKLDVTIGTALRKDRRWIMQIQTGQNHGADRFARLAPSIVIPVRDTVHAEFGLSYGVLGEKSLGAMASIWMDF
jgi:hypothetical protein